MRKHPSGASLTSQLVALAVAAGAFFFYQNMQARQQAIRLESEIRTAQGQLRLLVQSTAGDPASISGSADREDASINTDLKNCLGKGEAGRCEHLVNESPSDGSLPGYPLRLFDSKGVEITGLHKPRGEPCAGSSAAGPACPVEVHASFVPVCPNTGATNPVLSVYCSQAEFIKVHFRVREAPGIVVKAMPQLAALQTWGPNGITGPSLHISQLVKQTTSLQTGQAGQGVCKPTQIVMGLKPDGAPNCVEDPRMRAIQCEVETVRAEAYGGATTSCDQNRVVLKLQGGMRKFEDCAGAGGRLVRLESEAPREPAASTNVQWEFPQAGRPYRMGGLEIGPTNIEQFNKKYVCVFRDPAVQSASREAQQAYELPKCAPPWVDLGWVKARQQKCPGQEGVTVAPCAQPKGCWIQADSRQLSKVSGALRCSADVLELACY